MKKELLIIFVKNPELGKVKTRLAATIGENKALNIYKKLLDHTRKTAINVQTDKVVFYSDFIDHSDEWEEKIFQKKVQNGAALGERMHNAFKWAFEKKYDAVCVIGSDCYELTEEVLIGAFKKLETKNVVVGPSFDGGYYLLGMTKLFPSLFKNKHWSTGTVFKETINDIEIHNLSASLLEVLHDVDVESDLKMLPISS